MNCIRERVLIIFLALGMAMPLLAVDFSRYAAILARRPFSSVVALDDIVDNVVTVVEPPAFVKDLRMCAISESPAGLRIGFVNIQAKPPQPYYLYIGDSEDGIELVDADYEKEGVLLRKGAEQFWLYMRDSMPSSPAAPPSSSQPGMQPSSPIGVPPAGVSRSRLSQRRGPGGARDSGSSYADRRRKRLEEMRERAAAARENPELTVEQRLQQYQMDLIRKGLTPLPIPLTPEMDRQLVAEGVLPEEPAE